MGWNIGFYSDKNIDENEVQVIVNNLPEKYCSKIPVGNTKQSWGWSTAVDVDLPKSNYIVASGSYGISGNIAIDFALHFKRELEKVGHKIELDINV